MKYLSDEDNLTIGGVQEYLEKLKTLISDGPKSPNLLVPRRPFDKLRTCFAEYF